MRRRMWGSSAGRAPEGPADMVLLGAVTGVMSHGPGRVIDSCAPASTDPGCGASTH